MESPLSDDPNDDFNRFSSALFDEKVRKIELIFIFLSYVFI